MILAGLIVVLGLLSVAVLTQWYGYRLGGTITVSVLALYTLRDMVMLPIFVLSFALAYIGLRLLKDRTLIYGRKELLSAILFGSLIPLAVFFTLSLLTNNSYSAVLFIGSILPGLAAYNYHQLKPEQRRSDLLAAGGLLFGLLTLGFVLITPVNAARFGTLTPPVLFAQTAEVAVFKGATVSTPPDPELMQNRLGAVVLLIGMALAEWLRQLFGLRLGVVSIALLSIFSLASVWLLVLFAITIATSYLIIEMLNRTTLLYGRVLIGIGTALSVTLSVPLAVELPVVRGLSALLVGILAGIGGYNLHVTASGHRRTFVALSAAVFLPLLALALSVGRPQPNAIAQSLTPTLLAVITVLTVVSFGFAYWSTPRLPNDTSVLAASILGGGDGA